MKVVQLHEYTKNSPLGPQKVKNDPQKGLLAAPDDEPNHGVQFTK